MTDYESDMKALALEYFGDVPGIERILADNRACDEAIRMMLRDTLGGKPRRAGAAETLEGFLPTPEAITLLAAPGGQHHFGKFGGVPLFSRGTVQSIFGTSHTGKTTLMVAVSSELIREGKRVLWLIWDGTPEQVRGLFNKMGIPDHVLGKHWAYKSRPGKITVPASLPYDLIVADNYNTWARAWYPNESENSNDTAAALLSGVCRSLASAGPAVVILDNLSDKPGTALEVMGARGASAKRDNVDVSRRLDKIGKGFSGESAGAVRLVNVKDRVTGWDLDKTVGVFDYDGVRFHCKAGAGAVEATLDDWRAENMKSLAGLDVYCQDHWLEWGEADGLSGAELVGFLSGKPDVPMCTGKAVATVRHYVYGKGRDRGILKRGLEQGWLLPDLKGDKFRYAPPSQAPRITEDPAASAALLTSLTMDEYADPEDAESDS